MLCTPCSKRAYTADIGTCKSCGTWTPSGMLNLCGKCSIARNECEHCNKPLSGGGGGGRKGGGGGKKGKGRSGGKGGGSGDQTSTASQWRIAINTNHYLSGKEKPTTPAGWKDLTTTSVTKFKEDLIAFLRKKRLVRRVTILNEWLNLGIILVDCPTDVADQIAKLPGAKSVSPTRKIELIRPVPTPQARPQN